MNRSISKIAPSAFLALSANWCGDIARIVLLAESKGNKGWVWLARAKPTQKRIQVSDKSGELAKILS